MSFKRKSMGQRSESCPALCKLFTLQSSSVLSCRAGPEAFQGSCGFMLGADVPLGPAFDLQPRTERSCETSVGRTSISRSRRFPESKTCPRCPQRRRSSQPCLKPARSWCLSPTPGCLASARTRGSTPLSNSGVLGSPPWLFKQRIVTNEGQTPAAQGGHYRTTRAPPSGRGREQHVRSA